MANLTRNFIRGRMNKVVDERLVPDGEYIDATNIRMGSTENSEIGVIENTKGNVPLTALAYLDGTPLSIDAVCIGAIDDSANETLYWFVHDPNFPVGPTGKLDLIVSFNVLTNILTYHVISINDGNGINTTLNFNPSYLITGIDLVNDLLFFTDNYNGPRFINIRRGYANPTAGFIDFGGVPLLLEESLLVIKKPPTEAPSVAPFNMGGDNNYLQDRFICFAYRYRYADGEYSATSQWSEPAFIPNEFEFDYTSYLNEGMTNAFNSAQITYYSGGPLVVGIDLLFKEADKNIIKVIEKFDKSVLGIPDFSYQTITFDNSKIFTVLSEGELLRLYDNVPRFAKAQTIMGNRLMYGNYIEGYDLIDRYGNPTRLEYSTSFVASGIGLQELTTSIENAVYTIDPSAFFNSNGILAIDLSGVSLDEGALISITFNFETSGFSGPTSPTTSTPETTLTFSYILPTSYSSVYDMATSIGFQNRIGTVSNIKPVYSPIIGADTSCDGVTLTDQMNCIIPNLLATTVTTGSIAKIASGITGVNQPISIIVSPGSDILRLQIIAMQRVDDLLAPTIDEYEYYRITSSSATYQKVSSTKSLHSNRGYEIGIVYMDDFNRSTTALVSQYNTEYIPCSNSSSQNFIFVSIPPSQIAPAWATRFKFVCKADIAGYETIYSDKYYTLGDSKYLLLEGENARKVEEGDRLIVKSDSSGPLLNCVYTTVLEKKSQGAGFVAGAPAGVYMKITPSGFNITGGLPPLNSGWTQSVYFPVVSGSSTILYWPVLIMGVNYYNPATALYEDYPININSTVSLKMHWRRGPTSIANTVVCQGRVHECSLNNLQSSASYSNTYDWFIGEDIASLLPTGFIDTGPPPAIDFCSPPYSINSSNPLFDPTLYSFSSYSAFTTYIEGLLDPCVNKVQFFRNTTTNQLLLICTGPPKCPVEENFTQSSVDGSITIYPTSSVAIFETIANDTLPDVFFENNLSFPINPTTGDHLSNGAPGDISQDISLGTTGYFQTGFFNCFSFGNGAESYKIRDSIVGRTFNLGNRVTTVSAQDYKEAHRFADITYSGVYNQENNVNKLNEFNLGLLNYKNLETSFGPIQKMDGRETDVLTLQEDKISYVLAGKNLLSDSTGGGVISSVPEVLGTQIARIDKYGISSNPESYIQWGYDKYFTDVKRGAVIMLRGNSPSEQLTVVSESNMRTWFRDTFIAYPNNQMLGAFDPYMNEYVLCVTDRELPGEPQCLDCNVSQTFTLSNPDPLAKNVAEYCVDLGMAVGNSTVSWTVTSISAFGSFEVEVTYDGITYTSGVTTTSGSVSFFKSSNTINTATVTISVLDDVVLNVTAECPIPEELTIIEVVLTTNTDAAKTIHAQYRYQLGAFVGPLQSNLVLFQSGIVNPLVSRYNASTGIVGTGSFPPQGSTLTLQTNKIGTDDFVFNPASDKFRYLRSNVFYPNTPATISSLIAASTVATPISGGPTIYNTNFIVPPSVDGNYLYLIWDLRKSIPAELCYEATSNPDEICCQCAPCAEACISLIFSNESAENEAEIYLPSGLCGEGAPVTITLDPSEVTAPICITNAEYEISFGSVTIEISECGCVGCTENCTEYAVFTSALPSKVNYTDCNGNPVVNYNIAANSIEAICVQVGSPAPTGSGSPIIQATDSCGCCSDPDPCITFLITESKGIGYGFSYNDCFGGVQVVSLGPYESIQVCGRASIFFKDLGPFNYDAASIEIIDTCACVSGCTETCQSYTIACIASNASGSYTDCNGDTQSFSLLKGQSITICAPLGVPPTAVGSASVFTASTCGCCTPTCQEYKITFLGTVVQDYLVGYRDCTNTYVVDSFPYGTTDVYICAYVNTVPSVDGSLAIEDWTIEITNGCGCGF